MTPRTLVLLKLWRLITVMSAVRFWIDTLLSSVIDVKSIFASIPRGKNGLAQNRIPIISVIIIVDLVWIICFSASIVAVTEQGEAVFPSSIISARSVKRNAKRVVPDGSLKWKRLF